MVTFIKCSLCARHGLKCSTCVILPTWTVTGVVLFLGRPLPSQGLHFPVFLASTGGCMTHSHQWNVGGVRCDITGIELFKIFVPSSSSTIRGRRFWGPGRGWRHKIKAPSLLGDGSLLPTRVTHIGQWLKTKIEFYGINSIGEDIELEFISYCS